MAWLWLWCCLLVWVGFGLGLGLGLGLVLVWVGFGFGFGFALREKMGMRFSGRRQVIYQGQDDLEALGIPNLGARGS